MPEGVRRPTSHERFSGRAWDASYRDGPAPWDIGGPQPVIVRLASKDRFAAPVLDAGCGSGENAMHVACHGVFVLGIDVAETALAMARAKADERGLNVEFAEADAFHLERLGRKFKTVMDCGLFHTFDREEKTAYVASLASVMEPGAVLYILCFSDQGNDIGPHPVSEEELRSAFDRRSGWNLVSIERERIQTRFHDDGAPAWLATIVRNGPESTAERVALWRALHAQIDAPPLVFEDLVGLKLLSPPDNWRERPDMDPHRAGMFRASIVARARFVDDLVLDAAAGGTRQYVILGAGLDTFAQRRADIASQMTVFEVDRRGPQMWKKHRLNDLGSGVPQWLRFVPVDFEKGDSWWDALLAAGFNTGEPAILACTGVSLYLTHAAIVEMLQRLAALAPGSLFAMTFVLPLDLVDPQERPGFEAAINGARAAGTRFVSFFAPDEIAALARRAGFKEAEIVNGNELSRRYFAGRSDALSPGNSEQFLIAKS